MKISYKNKSFPLQIIKEALKIISENTVRKYEELYDTLVCVRNKILESDDTAMKLLKSGFLVFSQSKFDLLDLLILNELTCYQVKFINDYSFLNKIVLHYPHYSNRPNIIVDVNVMERMFDITSESLKSSNKLKISEKLIFENIKMQVQNNPFLFEFLRPITGLNDYKTLVDGKYIDISNHVLRSSDMDTTGVRKPIW